MRRLADGVSETFELILYDPEFHPTYSGDGAIVYQYLDIRNGAGEGRNDTPYCTIGIGNLNDTDGLEYTYWNTFTRGAKQLESEMAIKFTTAAEFITGSIEGTVTDLETGDPIPSATLITSRGFWAETDEEGHYIVEDILIGEDYSITASKQGWNDSMLTGFDIEEDDVLNVDFALLHPEFTPSVEEMERALNIDGNTQIEFELTNTGNGPLEWRVERHLRGDANADPWDLREQIPAGAIANDARVQGVVYANDHFYASGANARDPQIYVINREGELIDQFDQPGGGGSYGFKDLAFDGEWIWGSGSATIYAINLEGELMAEFEGPFNPTNNLTWDRDREILWAASTTSNIIGIDREGNQVAELNRQGMRMYGLAYWPDSPDGFSIYVYHKDNEIGDNIISKMNPDNGDVELVDILMPEGAGTPAAAFITNQYDVYSWVLVAAANRGAEDRFDIWQIDARKDWFSVDPEEGVVETDEVQGFTLTLDATELPPVVFEGDLVYLHNAIGGETRISVTLQVNGGPGQRAQRMLELIPGWNMVSLNIVPNNNDIVELVSPLVEENLLMIVKDGLGRFYYPEHGFNNIPEWAVTDGYLMYLRGNAEMLIDGRTIAEDDPIPLAEGWNMKAYYPNEPIDAVVALALIADRLEIAKDVLGHFYIPEFEFSNIGDMITGQGYQFKVVEQLDLVYNIGERLATAPEPSKVMEHFITPSVGGKNLSILAIASEEFVGWEVGVFTEGEVLIGSGFVNSDGIAGIAAWEDNPFTDQVDGAVSGDILQFRIWNGNQEFDSRIEPMTGENIWTPDGLLIGHIFAESTVPVEFGIHNSYPNPFNSQVRLSYGLTDNTEMAMHIFDVRGRLVTTLAKGEYKAGNHQIFWNASQVTSGLYFAQLEAAGQTATIKLMLVK
ncbi:MAG: T9SS type A sorting domain-containing protein [Calditrichaeota bacterium]|nr:T9SS type A sorting domain-containing protein [Calditrichota bacterium]